MTQAERELLLQVAIAVADLCEWELSTGSYATYAGMDAARKLRELTIAALEEWTDKIKEQAVETVR